MYTLGTNYISSQCMSYGEKKTLNTFNVEGEHTVKDIVLAQPPRAF